VTAAIKGQDARVCMCVCMYVFRKAWRGTTRQDKGHWKKGTHFLCVCVESLVLVVHECDSMAMAAGLVRGVRRGPVVGVCVRVCVVLTWLL
jgi:hypothetical protein